MTKVQSVYLFKQSPWLAEYINHNAQVRTKVETNVEKEFFIIMNNAFFSKTMEKIRDRVNLESISQGQIPKIYYRQSKLSFKGIVDRMKILVSINTTKNVYLRRTNLFGLLYFLTKQVIKI